MHHNAEHIKGFYFPTHAERKVQKGFNSELTVARVIAESHLCWEVAKNPNYSPDDMQGKDLTVRLRKDRETKHIPHGTLYVQVKSNIVGVNRFLEGMKIRGNLTDEQLHDQLNMLRLIPLSAFPDEEVILEAFEQKVREMNDFFRSTKL